MSADSDEEYIDEDFIDEDAAAATFYFT